jgi:predicted phosphate transport protein (TIGR00153 family)
MKFQVIPREQSFFDLFEASAQLVVDGAQALRELAEHFDDREARGRRVKDLESEGDEITHRVMATLNTTFVTPFDREDIYTLASKLDDVLDSMEAAADLLVLHRIDEPLPELRQQADVLARITTVMLEAVRKLRTLHDADPHLVEINRLENEGDRVYRKTVARLYSGDFKAMDVLKWKDIVDEMELAIDTCEDIANAIESITLKHA